MMDNPGTSATNPNNVCKLCNSRPRLYTCPRCEVGYCSTDCYKSEAHLECSESFYKQCVQEELQSQENNPETRKKMIEILKRVHEQDLGNIDFLTSNEEEEEEEEELNEQLDSDDEDVPDLEKRLQEVNLDNADEVWSALTDSEKQEFEALIKTGEIEKLLPEWIPWWIHNNKKKLVQDMDEQEDEQTMQLPSVVDVPLLNELQKASPKINYNITNVIYAYAYIAIYYNGDYLSCPIEATIVFLNLCDNMKLNTIFESTESAMASVVHSMINCDWLPHDEQTLTAFQEAGNIILQGPDERNKYLYIAIALSELHRLFTATKVAISKQTNKNESKEFSKKFAQRYNINNVDLSKKALFLHCKKLEYYLSWTKSCHMKAYT